jgi:hypothetical protein
VRGLPGAPDCAASTTARFVCHRGPWAAVGCHVVDLEGDEVELIVERSAALDVHKAQVTACVRVPDEHGHREEHIAEFATTVRGLLALRDWLAAHQVQQVVMEATASIGRRRGRSSKRTSSACWSTPGTSSRSRAARPTSRMLPGCAGSPRRACSRQASCRPSRSASCATSRAIARRRSKNAPAKSTGCTRRSRTPGSSWTASRRTSWANRGATCSTRWSPARPTQTSSRTSRAARCARRSPRCAKR